jgi:hypothetical protein
MEDAAQSADLPSRHPLLRTIGEEGTEREGDDDGDSDPGPDAGEEVAPLGLDEVGDEDYHDEAGLQPLAQPDQVVPQGK